MKNKIQKIKDIIQGNTMARPIGEDWFKNRLEICNSCPFNSKNAEGQGKTWFRENIVAKLDKNGEYCTACGCPIESKASLGRSVCGLAETKNPELQGMKPKWNAIEVENDVNSFFSVTNLSHTVCDLEYNDVQNTFSFNFKESSEKVLKAKFKIYSPYKCQYKTLNQDPCFFIDLVQMEDHLVITATISTANFKENLQISKHFSIYFEQYKGENKAEFCLKFSKTESK